MKTTRFAAESAAQAKAETNDAWRKVIATDPVVYGMVSTGQPLERIICALVEQKQRLLSEIQKLHLIAPRKVVMQDGTVMVWRCPDELIPD